MDVHDQILKSLPRRGKRIVSIWLIWGIAVAVGILSPVAGALVFIVGLIWLQATKLKIPDQYFEKGQHFSDGALSLSRIRSAIHFGHRAALSFLHVDKFNRIGAKYRFLVLDDKTNLLILTPQRFWSRLDNKYLVGDANKIRAEWFYYEAECRKPGLGDEIVGTRWEHATKNGERDYRFKDNHLLTVVKRYGVELTLPDGTEWNVAIGSKAASDTVLAQFRRVLGAGISEQASSSDSKQNSESRSASEDAPGTSSTAKDPAGCSRSWSDILGVPPNASRETIKEARDKLVWGFHPDRLKSIDGISPELERYASDKLVEINLAYEQAVSALKP